MLKTPIKAAHGRPQVRPTMVFTIGHSTRSIEAFIDMLKARSKAIGRCADDPAFQAQSTIQSRCFA